MSSSRVVRLVSTRIGQWFHPTIRASAKPWPNLFEANKSSPEPIKLPNKHLNDFMGDKKCEKIPIFDFKQTDFFYCSALINSGLAINPNVYRWQPIPGTSMENIQIPMPKPIIPIELPTTRQNDLTEKKADYYKHKDRNRFTHLTWVRHRKMKKHQRIKWRKKNLAMIKRRILERNIAKEKLFRAELLAQIKEAEDFDPKAYVRNILYTIDNVPQPETPQQKYERYLDLIRKNRKQTNMVIPKFEEKLD